jgi:importin subunit alpha-6/7
LAVLSALSSMKDHDFRMFSDVIIQIFTHALESDVYFQYPACCIIKNLSSGTGEETQFLLDINVLEVLSRCIEHKSPVIVKEICWTIGNLLAGTEEQFRSILSSGIMKQFVEKVDCEDYSVAAEAAWVLEVFGTNSLKFKVFEHAIRLVEKGILDMVRKILQMRAMEIIRRVSVFVNAILQIAKITNVDLIEEFTQSGCFNALETCQIHADKETGDFIQNILANYFDCEDNLSDYEMV